MSGPHTGEDVTAPTMWPNGDLLPSKPTAHLTGECKHHVPSFISITGQYFQ